MYAAQVLVYMCKVGAYSPSWIMEMPLAPVGDACGMNICETALVPPVRARHPEKPCGVLQAGTLVSTWLGGHSSAIIHMRALTLLMVSRHLPARPALSDMHLTIEPGQ